MGTHFVVYLTQTCEHNSNVFFLFVFLRDSVTTASRADIHFKLPLMTCYAAFFPHLVETLICPSVALGMLLCFNLLLHVIYTCGLHGEYDLQIFVLGIASITGASAVD